MMIITRFDADRPTVIPAELLAQLGLKPGDEIAIDLIGDKIVVMSADDRFDGFVGNFSTFWEWDTEADREAFRNL